MLAGGLIASAVPAGLGWDFANFYDAGRVMLSGHHEQLLKTEKGPIDGAPPQGVLDFWGTPLSAWLYAPLALLSPQHALAAFKLENVLAYGAALWLLYAWLRRAVAAQALQQWRFAACYAGLALVYQPFWSVFRVGGQTTASVLLLLCIALFMHARRAFLRSSLLVVLAVMIKPALAIALLFLLLVSGLRFALSTGLWLALLGALSIALMGWDIQLEFIHKMLTGAARVSEWQYNSSLFTLPGELRRWNALQDGAAWPDGAFSAMLLLLKLALLASLVWVVRRTRPLLGTGAREHFDFMLAIMAFLLLSQTVWEHYLSFMFLPLAWLLAVRPRLDRAVMLMAVVFAAALPLQNIIVILLLQNLFAFDTLTAVLPVVVLKSAPVWLGWIFLLRYHRELAGIPAADGTLPARTTDCIA